MLGLPWSQASASGITDEERDFLQLPDLVKFKAWTEPPRLLRRPVGLSQTVAA